MATNFKDTCMSTAYNLAFQSARRLKKRRTANGVVMGTTFTEYAEGICTGEGFSPGS